MAEGQRRGASQAEGQSGALGVLGEQKWVAQPAKQTVVWAALRTHVAEPRGIWEVLGFIPVC